uniref:MFS_1_like domain-containing protein n=2 Tax=Steinernema glaseri TaxID=37863 RepID=A0A1I7YR70_9BILA
MMHKMDVRLVYIPLTVMDTDRCWDKLLSMQFVLLKIFLADEKYRKKESYRIMILMGIIQCATAPAAFILSGVVHLLDYDPWGIAAIALKFYPGGFRAESMISFILALNRFRIICGQNYPDVIHKALIAFSCTAGTIYTLLLFTPLCEYRIIPGHYLMEYNRSIPSCRMIQIIGSYFVSVPSIASLLLYIIMIAFLIKMKMKSASKGSAEERRILFYALSRFVIESSFVGTFHYAELPHYPEFDITINVGLMCGVSSMSVVFPTYILDRYDGSSSHVKSIFIRILEESLLYDHDVEWDRTLVIRGFGSIGNCSAQSCYGFCNKLIFLSVTIILALPPYYH